MERTAYLLTKEGFDGVSTWGLQHNEILSTQTYTPSEVESTLERLLDKYGGELSEGYTHNGRELLREGRASTYSVETNAKGKKVHRYSDFRFLYYRNSPFEDTAKYDELSVWEDSAILQKRIRETTKDPWRNVRCKLGHSTLEFDSPPDNNFITAKFGFDRFPYRTDIDKTAAILFPDIPKPNKYGNFPIHRYPTKQYATRKEAVEEFLQATYLSHFQPSK